MRKASAVLLAVACLLGTSGCESPGPQAKPSTPTARGGTGAAAASYIDIESIPKQDDIVRIVQFWGQDPWIYDSIGRAVGFKVPTYFVSMTDEKGVFVSGRVFVWVHVVQRSRAGELVRRTVHMWQMDQAESFLFAARKQAIGGYFYGFILAWPRSLDLTGQTLEIEFAYERADGKLVLSAGRTFRVPLDPREAFTDPFIRPKRPGRESVPPLEGEQEGQPLRQPIAPPLDDPPMPPAREPRQPVEAEAATEQVPASTREQLLKQLEERARRIRAEQQKKREQTAPADPEGGQP